MLHKQRSIGSINGEESNDTDTAVTTAGGDGSRSNGFVRGDSPLDFSTKKKLKPEPLLLKGARQRSGSFASAMGGGSEALVRETSESPCSRLRNILSMKSPSVPDMTGAVLNLSKESPLTTIWSKSDGDGQSNSSSSSPTHEHSPRSAFVQSHSPRPISMAATTVVVPPVESGVLNGWATLSSATSSLGMPSWGSGVYSPSISPTLNQTVPANGVTLPLSFETSPTLFPHHIASGATSPALPFAASLSLPMPNNGSCMTNSKARATRPFKVCKNYFFSGI